eukprot:scaffold197573_cov39-Prasinocladus_malaysianus.AAC.1
MADEVKYSFGRNHNMHLQANLGSEIDNVGFLHCCEPQTTQLTVIQKKDGLLCFPLSLFAHIIMITQSRRLRRLKCDKFVLKGLIHATETTRHTYTDAMRVSSEFKQTIFVPIQVYTNESSNRTLPLYLSAILNPRWEIRLGKPTVCSWLESIYECEKPKSYHCAQTEMMSVHHRAMRHGVSYVALQ